MEIQEPSRTEVVHERAARLVQRIQQLVLRKRARQARARVQPWHCAACDSWHTPGVRVCVCGARREP